MEEILIIIAAAEGAIILFLGGHIAKAIFRMADSIKSLTATLAEFVKKDDCKEDMGDHCTKINGLECRMDKHEKAFAELKAKAEVWHKD
jgi:hypothetical protein